MSRNFTQYHECTIVQAANDLAHVMENEAVLIQGVASNMVKGEAPIVIQTVNGVKKISCIDPKDKENRLLGFELPSELGEDIGDGQCKGCQVCKLCFLFHRSLSFAGRNVTLTK